MKTTLVTFERTDHPEGQKKLWRFQVHHSKKINLKKTYPLGSLTGNGTFRITAIQLKRSGPLVSIATQEFGTFSSMMAR